MKVNDFVSEFHLLARPVRKALLELGFSRPTPPQILAFQPILEEKNILLIAPTGTGKTEAVLLPVLSKIVIQKDVKQNGIQIIYVTPLKALNRDMIKRLRVWSEKLDISMDIRHGDTEMRIRRKQAKTPPQILVTTPETLQAILPGSQMRKHLEKVQFVIVDEIHELASNKRGSQLSLGLERLERLQKVTKKSFQRIGLSATVGNPQEIASIL
jgi:ATP-dependent helicase Lhr and Lhr-like helicase